MNMALRIDEPEIKRDPAARSPRCASTSARTTSSNYDATATA